MPDSAVRFGGPVKFDRLTFPWWLENPRPQGPGAPQLFNFGHRAIVTEMIEGEDRIATSSVQLRLVVDAPASRRRPCRSSTGSPRSRARRAEPPGRWRARISVLPSTRWRRLRGHPLDRQYRVWLDPGVTSVTPCAQLSDASAWSQGADSRTAQIIWKAAVLGSVFFRVRGTLAAGGVKVFAVAEEMKRGANGSSGRRTRVPDRRATSASTTRISSRSDSIATRKPMSWWSTSTCPRI